MTGNDEGLILLDVGATYTRALIPNVSSDQPLRARVSSASELLGFVGELIQRKLVARKHTLVGGFAGPVSEGASVRLTNWQEALLTTDDFLALGVDDVFLLNDVEAAAYGLNDLLERDTADVAPVTGQPQDPSGHRALVVPGTGLGTAVILDAGKTGTEPTILPSEAQHAVAGTEELLGSPLFEKAMKALGRQPTWEDFVSGRGLEMLYRLAAHSSNDGSRLSAAEIAELALQGQDQATDALHAYYACLGLYCQLVGLAFLAFGGVFVGGSTTRKNAPLVSASPMAEAFSRNVAMDDLLQRIPLALVTQELNLRGAMAFARYRYADP